MNVDTNNNEPVDSKTLRQQIKSSQKTKKWLLTHTGVSIIPPGMEAEEWDDECWPYHGPPELPGILPKEDQTKHPTAAAAPYIYWEPLDRPTQPKDQEDWPIGGYVYVIGNYYNRK